MKVLLIGHGCSPRHGSEPGATWNWAWHLSMRNRVWLLAHPHERAAVEAFLGEHPNPNLRCCWVTPPGWLDPWNPRRGKRWIRLHYLLWQRAALHEAARLHQAEGFDIAHHVSWGSVSRPPLLWRLPIPLVWGPLGGGQVAPAAFRRYFGSSWMGESLRTAYVRMAARRPILQKAAQRSALLLATNHETASLLESAGGRDIKLFLDSGLPDQFVPSRCPERKSGPLLKLLWAGRLEAWKCLPLALEAMSQVRDLPLRLLIAGDGPLRREWEALAGRLGLGGKVAFLGQIPHAEMPALYRSADAFIFTSLRDSFGAQVLEAMAAGLPIVTLDHQGAGAFVPSEAGIKVPVTLPEETVAGLAMAIRTLSASHELRARMGRAGWRYAKTETWARRVGKMNEWYELVVSRQRSVPEARFAVAR